MLVFLLFLFVIRKAVAVGDGRLAIDRAAGEEHRIDERCLPATPVAGDKDISNIRGGVGGHIQNLRK